MQVSDDVLVLDEVGKTKFVSLIAQSIATLLDILSQYVSATVHNFRRDRRLLMTTYQFEARRLTMARRLATDLDISYSVATTENQVSAISDSLTNDVASGLADNLNDLISEDGSLNVTAHSITNF